MRVIVSQVRKASADPDKPLMIHNGYSIMEHCGEMFTADPGYEIGAVYIVPETS